MGASYQPDSDRDEALETGVSQGVEVYHLPVEQLSVDPERAHKAYEEESLSELARSIRTHGLLMPLIVRPARGPGNQGNYWIIAGVRRYYALLLLGYATAPCYVQGRSHTVGAVKALITHIHRKDLSDIARAEALKQLKTLSGLSWGGVADLVGLSPVYIRQLGGLLKLEASVQELVRRGVIPARTALALKPLPAWQQVELAGEVLRGGLTAEEIRKLTRRNEASRSTRTTEEEGAADPQPPPGGRRTRRSISTGSNIPESGRVEVPQLANPPPQEMLLTSVLELLEHLDQQLVPEVWVALRLSEPDHPAVQRLLLLAETLHQRLETLLRVRQDPGEPDAEQAPPPPY